MAVLIENPNLTPLTSSSMRRASLLAPRPPSMTKLALLSNLDHHPLHFEPRLSLLKALSSSNVTAVHNRNQTHYLWPLLDSFRELVAGLRRS